MSHRLLLVEQEPSSSCALEAHLRDCGLAAATCETAAWDPQLMVRLRECTADAILPVVVREPADARQLFAWASGNPLPKPILAVLPDSATVALLRAAADVADDFVLWPAGRGELPLRLSRMLGGRPGHDLASVRARLTGELGLANLLGSDPAFLRVVETLPLAARSASPVLITGETGTGKELSARAIHHLSARRNFPFIAVDCGALPDHLFENEMFGHARGAFTDAQRDQKGLVALAEGGTLFLDEVDALSVPAQAKLLRFLQDRTYKPLGAERFLSADVRILAATNRDLEACVREKRFREDLFFRLNVLRVQVVPLRERPADIGLLARHFLETTCREASLPHKRLSPAALRKLSSYHWPGNVRELLNVVQRAALFSNGVHIMPGQVALREAERAEVALPQSFRRAKAHAIESFERVYVESLLRKHDGNVTRAAREAQKDRRAFGRLVKKYKLGPPGP